jgi:hypothetical protein
MDTSVENISNFAEIRALYAILCEDEDTAARIIGDMLPGERITFSTDLDRLCSMARWAAEHPGQTPDGSLARITQVEPLIIDHTDGGPGR